MGTAWFLARSTSAIQSDAILLIVAASGVVVASLLVYIATRKRYNTQWIVFACIVFIVLLTSIVLVTHSVNSLVNAVGVQP